MRSALVGLAVPLILLLGACSGADDPVDVPLGEVPSFPTEGPPLWNPCDGLVLTKVQQAVGVDLTEATGTEQAPQCTFTPKQDGDPALDVNYQLYPGSLEELIGTFGVPEEGTEIDVTTPEVAGAADARLVVSVVDDTLAVTGFVQTGDLVQVVNGIDPTPFARAALVAAVRTVMTDLAEHADESGLS